MEVNSETKAATEETKPNDGERWAKERTRVAAKLRKLGTPDDLAAMYASSWVLFREAQESIDSSGAIFSDRRTGQPLQNPWVAIRASALRELQALRGKVRFGDLWTKS